MVEKPKLFLTLKQFWVSTFLLLSILSIRIFFIYDDYKEFREKPFYYTEVKVIQAYTKTKNRKSYTVLKLYSRVLNLTLFTITSIPPKELNNRLRVKLFPNYKMKFKEYLGVSFISSKINRIFPKDSSLKSNIIESISNQHRESIIANFYNAILLAEPLEKKLRNQVSKLGISHLIALSGFHLGILSSLLFFLLRPIYRFFQQKYFPYRFDLIDIGFLVIAILAWYIWFVDYPPSLIRSYMMILTTWILLLLGVELLTLSFLTTIILILLIIFPHLLLSLAFWFSVTGVFYIFLLLHYFSNLSKIKITLIISFGIFILMLPIVHIVFPITSPLQILSPFLSLLFTIFYPLIIVLHLFGLGDILDSILIKLFTLDSLSIDKIISPYIGILYLLLSLGAFYFKKIFYFLIAISFGFSIWFFIIFWI